MRFPRLSLLLLASATISTISVCAQDITVGSMHSFDTSNPPDAMPAAKEPLRVDYPSELRHAHRIGYVIVTRYVDADGQSRSLELMPSQAAFKEPVQSAVIDWSFRPAQRAGKAVAAKVWFPVMFNPESAGDDAPNAIARLLAAAPVIVPELPASRNVTLDTRFSVDADGAIAAAKPEVALDPKYQRAFDEAMRLWRFTPARQGGKSIASEVTLPVIFLENTPGVKERQELPKVISQPHPEYPRELQRYSIGGNVLVDFVVDTDGAVQNAYAVRSNNPLFEDPALEAVRRWRFKPGKIGDRPVNTHMQVPIQFQMPDRTNEMFSIRGDTDQSKLPPELRFDTPPKLRNVAIPVYPYELRRDDITGGAKVSILIGPDGRVAATRVLQADRPEFGQALLAAVEQFEFDPALKDGKPVSHLIAFEQRFNASELPDSNAEGLLRTERKHPERIHSAAKLDAPLRPISQKPPAFPLSVEDSVTAGKAVIECLIDENGRVRLPRIFEATDPAFGYAAVQSLNAWSFRVPKIDGRPTTVRVRIPVIFQRK